MTLEEKLQKIHEDAKKTYDSGKAAPVRYKLLATFNKDLPVMCCVLGAAHIANHPEDLDKFNALKYDEKFDFVDSLYKIIAKNYDLTPDQRSAVTGGFDEVFFDSADFDNHIPPYADTTDMATCYKFGKKMRDEFIKR